jgi:hypothetical protein
VGLRDLAGDITQMPVGTAQFFTHPGQFPGMPGIPFSHGPLRLFHGTLGLLANLLRFLEQRLLLGFHLLDCYCIGSGMAGYLDQGEKNHAEQKAGGQAAWFVHDRAHPQGKVFTLTVTQFRRIPVAVAAVAAD